MGQLEPRLRAILRARIKDWLIERRLTTIIVTHDQTEALALCDRIAVMEAGVLQQLATPQELKDRPANLFVASFIGEPPMNVFEARVERDGGPRLVAQNLAGADAFVLPLRSDGTAGVLASAERVHLGIRPHLIDVGDHGLAERHRDLQPVAWRPDPSRRRCRRLPADHRGGRRDRCAGAEHGAGLARRPSRCISSTPKAVLP